VLAQAGDEWGYTTAAWQPLPFPGVVPVAQLLCTTAAAAITPQGLGGCRACTP
jgi:hypothetical protein